MPPSYLMRPDGDGIREIVTFSYFIRVYNASDLTQLASVSLSRIYSQGVIADLDLDGKPEIVAGADTGLVAYNYIKGTGLVSRTGFPIVAVCGTGMGEVRSVSVYDLDGDGSLEIVISCTDYPAVQVFASDGSIYQPIGTTAAWLNGPMASPAWPRYNNLTAPQGDANKNNAASPTSLGYGQNTGIYDLDGDGLAEVVWTSSNGIEVFRLDGFAENSAAKYDRSARGWTFGQQQYRWANATFDELFWTGSAAFPDTNAVEYNKFSAASPTFADISGDGVADIVLAADALIDSSSEEVARQLQGFAFMPASARGGRVERATVRSGPSICTSGCPAGFAAPVPVDLDFDDTIEFLFPGGDGKLYCVSNNGSLRWSYDVAHSQANNVVTEPVVADLNGDGLLDIIAASSAPPGALLDPWMVVLDRFGNLQYENQLTGSSAPNGAGSNGLSVIDRLGNGILSVFVATYGGTIVYDVVNPSPSLCAPWPVQRGGFLRRGARDYIVSFPNSCPTVSPAYAPPGGSGGSTGLTIDLRLLNGTAPAVIRRSSTMSFNVIGLASAANYGITFSTNSTRLIATLSAVVPPSPSPTPAVTGLPGVPITGYIFIDGDVQLLPNSTLSIVVAVDGSGGYINASGCVDVQGALNISVGQLPNAGQNVTFIESPCITFTGTSTVEITAPGSDGCDGVEGRVGEIDSTHFGVVFSPQSCKEKGLSGLVIAGIVVGVVVLVGVITAIGILLAKHMRGKRMRRPSSRRVYH